MMLTSLSIHNVKTFKATNNDAVPHLTIEVEGDDWKERSSVTFFIDDEILNSRLIEAINSVVAERKAEIEAAKQPEADAA